jgi:hypothetical protein
VGFGAKGDVSILIEAHFIAPQGFDNYGILYGSYASEITVKAAEVLKNRCV